MAAGFHQPPVLHPGIVNQNIMPMGPNGMVPPAGRPMTSPGFGNGRPMPPGMMPGNQQQMPGNMQNQMQQQQHSQMEQNAAMSNTGLPPQGGSPGQMRGRPGANRNVSIV